jgi:O-antigen ligase
MIKNIIEGKHILYIVASIIPFLTISIFIADLIYSFLAIIFLIYLIGNNFRLNYKNIFFLFSIIFYFVCVISSFLSNDILFSLKSSLPLIRVFLFIFLLSYLISFNENLNDILYNFFIITFSVLVLHGFFQYIYEYNYLFKIGQLDNVNIRLNLLFSDEEKIGSFLIRLYGLFLALHIVKKNKSNAQNIFFIILTLLCSIIVLLSGERTSLFFMVIFFFICLILLSIKFKIKLICISLILTSFFILLSLNSNLAKRTLFDANNKFNFSKDNIIIFTPQHTAHYKSAAKMFLDNPFFGKGPKMFRVDCSKEKYLSYVDEIFTGCSSHPHNTYLQLLAETGLIGTSLFTFLFAYIIYNLIKHFLLLILYRKRNLTDYQIILSATVLITFWPFSPAGNFFNNWLLIIYSLPLSFYIYEFFGYKMFSKS